MFDERGEQAIVSEVTAAHQGIPQMGSALKAIGKNLKSLFLSWATSESSTNQDVSNSSDVISNQRSVLWFWQVVLN